MQPALDVNSAIPSAAVDARPGFQVMVTGAAEQALASAIRAYRNPSLPSGLDLQNATVEPSPKPVVGEFKVDLRPLLPPEIAPGKAICKQVAAGFGGMTTIDKALAIPPQIYLTTNAVFLYRQVVQAVLETGELYGRNERDPNGEGLTLVSFSSPNANKPLHLGHLRNNFIGMAVANLLEAQGHDVKRAEVVSDWGVHICQAVLAYRKWGDEATPESEEVKPDHFVGRYYVMFHQRNTEQASGQNDGGPSGVPAEANLEEEAAELLRQMKAEDAELLALNDRITEWAEQGIRQTYSRIGTDLDLVFHEKDTLEVGRELVETALREGRCLKRPDGSVYVDLTDLDLGEVTLLRRDGTPVVYTQLLGFHVNRYREHPFVKAITILGRQWEDGAKVVDEVLKRLGYEWVEGIERIHYGMVALPQGKMKSRQGTVVGADELLDQATAYLSARLSLGSDDPELVMSCETLATGLVKYHFLKTKRIKEILYNEQSLWETTSQDFAFVLRTLETAEQAAGPDDEAARTLPERVPDTWRSLLLQLNGFPRAVDHAALHREPAEIVRYLDDLCLAVKACRPRPDVGDPVWKATAIVLRRCLALLNIDVPGSLESFSPILGTST